MTRMRRKVKVLVGLALVWVTGAVYVIHSNRHEVGALNTFTIVYHFKFA